MFIPESLYWHNRSQIQNIWWKNKQFHYKQNIWLNSMENFTLGYSNVSTTGRFDQFSINNKTTWSNLCSIQTFRISHPFFTQTYWINQWDDRTFCGYTITNDIFIDGKIDPSNKFAVMNNDASFANDLETKYNFQNYAFKFFEKFHWLQSK